MNYKARNWVRRQSPGRVIPLQLVIEKVRHPKRALFDKVAADVQARRRTHEAVKIKWRPGIKLRLTDWDWGDNNENNDNK